MSKDDNKHVIHKVVSSVTHYVHTGVFWVWFYCQLVTVIMFYNFVAAKQGAF